MLSGSMRAERSLLTLHRDPWFAIAMVAGVLAAYLVSLMLAVPKQQGGWLAQQWSVQQWSVQQWSVQQWQQAFYLVLLYPVIEEWLFRGTIQAYLHSSLQLRLSATWLGLTPANWITSLMFALAHLIAVAPLWALLVVFPSLVFGWFYHRYQCVLPAIALHCAYNAAYFSSFGLPE